MYLESVIFVTQMEMEKAFCLFHSSLVEVKFGVYFDLNVIMSNEIPIQPLILGWLQRYQP